MRRKWKTALSVLACLTAVFVLCSCGGSGAAGDAAPQESSSQEAATTLQEPTSPEAATVLKETGSGEDSGEIAAEIVSDPEGFIKGNVAKKGIDVVAVFAGIDKQPITEEDGDKDNVDTIWVYYSDNTFEQFALVDDKSVLFSIGTYELSGGEDFIYDGQDKNGGTITINRTKKYDSVRGLVDHESSHTYELYTLGFTQLYAPDSPRKIVTIFSGPDKQPFKEIDQDDNETENERIDTWWIYYDDGSLEQYAEVHDKLELFSVGTYEFKDNGGFNYQQDEEEHGVITINRTKKYQDGKGLVDYESSHDYDLSTLGFDQLFVIVS